MPTIDFLMEGKKPGEIKICTPRSKSRNFSVWFQPYFKIRGSWWGPNENGVVYEYSGGLDNVDIYTEPKPKKKVVLYQWLEKSNKNPNYYISHYTNRDYSSDPSMKRLDHTRMELEVDDE